VKREFIGIMGKLSCELGEEGEVTVVTLEGQADVHTSEEVRRIVRAFLARGQARILIDAGELDYCDSSTLRVFLNLQKEARAAGGAIKFLKLAGEPRRVFEVSGFLHFFETFEDRPEALRSFGESK
jgi:anti-sigma B factor antagonist